MDWRIRLAIDRMGREIDQPLAVTALAERLHLSSSRFAHLFRSETGCAPARYLRQMRLDLARALAEETTLTVKEIMKRVGYNDPSHFARDFKRRHGLSPKKVQLRARSPGQLVRARPAGPPLSRAATADCGARIADE